MRTSRPRRLTAAPAAPPRLPRCRRNAADIAAANDVDLSKLRDPQPDSARAKDPNVSRRGQLSEGLSLRWLCLGVQHCRRRGGPGSALGAPP